MISGTKFLVSLMTCCRVRVDVFLARMLLAFTTRHMVRSVHFILSPIRFTAQFDFAVSEIYIRTRKYMMHRWGGEMG